MLSNFTQYLEQTQMRMPIPSGFVFDVRYGIGCSRDAPPSATSAVLVRQVRKSYLNLPNLMRQITFCYFCPSLGLAVRSCVSVSGLASLGIFDGIR